MTQRVNNAERFKIEVPQDDIDDLKTRLRRTRFLDDFGNDDWSYGFPTSYLREVVDHWADVYDWRSHEDKMNEFENYRTEIDGVPLHFMWERGSGEGGIPLVLMHGWPWTSWDLQKVIRPLAHPEEHGSPDAPSFDVIALSLPGFGFSSPLKQTGCNFHTTADLVAKLMDSLGYDRFAVAGGDWGALVAEQLGHKHADRLLGLYVHIPVMLSFFLADSPDEIQGVPFAGGVPAPEAFSADEAGWYEKNMAFLGAETGYAAIQATRPQSLAAGMNDSPAGLLAWLCEKRRSWADTNGDIESVWSKDDLCTTASIYWFTQTVGTAARYYKEVVNNPWRASHDRRPVVEAPSAVSVFVPDVMRMPHSWTERYFNLQQYRVYDKGGHFVPFEKPETYIADIRDFFAR